MIGPLVTSKVDGSRAAASSGTLASRRARGALAAHHHEEGVMAHDPLSGGQRES